MKFPLPRLFLPLLASLALHAALILPPSLRLAPRPTPRIEVRLPRLPAQLPKDAADDLLKNTLKGAEPGMEKTSPHAASGLGRAQARAQQQRLARHVFYPPRAVEQGLEGEVRLLLRLDGKGKLLEARVVSGSGHALLDEAALAAAHAAGSFPGAGGELILPVEFRLTE